MPDLSLLPKPRLVATWGDPEARREEAAAGVLVSSRVAHNRFLADMRLAEIQKLLAAPSRLHASFPQPPGVTDSAHATATPLFVTQQVGVSALLCGDLVPFINRVNFKIVGARGLGRAAFTFAMDEGDSVRRFARFEVPQVVRACRIAETRALVTLEDASFPPGFFDMIDFHTGTAAGFVYNCNVCYNSFFL